MTMKIYTSQSHHLKQNILITIKMKNILPEKLPEIDKKKKLPALVILGVSIVKEVKGWEASDENNKIVTKQFSEATNDDMKSYIQPTISNDPECIVLHCGNRDLMQKISAKNRNNTLISGIVPRRDKLNAKKAQVSNFLKIELGKRNI